MAAHRYWRVKFDTSAGAGCCAASEIQFRTALKGADVAAGGTAIASSIYSGSYPASAAFDDNNNTIWHDSCANHTAAYIGYDFGAGNEKDIIQFVFQSRGDGYGYRDSIKTGGLEYSDDGIAWTRYFDIPSQSNFGDREARIFGKPPVPAIVDAGGHRYWRARLTPAGNPGATFEGVSGIEFRRQGEWLTYFGRPIGPTNLQAGSIHAAFMYPDAGFGAQWGGTATDQWMGYDFGAGFAPLVDELMIRPNNDDPARTWREIAMDYSDDGVNWTEAAIVTPALPWVAATKQFFPFGTPPSASRRRQSIIVM